MESLFVKGGIFMWPLLLSLFITFVISFERWLYWIKIKAENNPDLRKLILNPAENPSLFENNNHSFEDKTAHLAYQAINKNILSQTDIEALLKKKSLSHNRFMRLLDVIVSIAPLLGILGTIWGIIQSFNLAGSINNIDPTTAMIGMSEAFITTAFGLIVSLVALFSFNYFQSLAEKELVTSDIYLTDLLVKISQRQ